MTPRVLTQFLESAYLKAHQTVYRRRLRRQVRFPDKYVISIGNLSAGGTGKTPATILLADHAPVQPPLVVLRGYKSDAPSDGILAGEKGAVIADFHHAGDEAVLIARAGPFRVAVGSDRAAVIRRFGRGCRVVLLDDAFQNPSVYRDHELVLLDASVPVDRMRLLPVGRFRDPVEALVRADTLLLTRTELCADLNALTSLVHRFIHPDNVFQSTHGAAGLVPAIAAGGKIGAFCGIGNPAAFFATLRRMGYELSGAKDFADHYEYRLRDLERLDRSIPWVTTEKDWVRIAPLAGSLPAGLKISRLAIRLEILEGRGGDFIRSVYSGLDEAG